MKAATTDGQGRYSHLIAPEAREWFDLFRTVRSWIVCAHLRPDADTLGSSLGLAHLLRALGSRAVVLCADPVVERYPFLPGVEDVLVNRLPEDLPAGTGVVTLDVAELDRLGSLASLVADFKPFVNLDHHISNQLFGTHNWIDLPSAATGELVILLYDHFGVPIPTEAAIPLYAALITDTGFFRYPSTTPRTLEMAAILLRAGFAFPSVVEALYEKMSPASVRLMGQALAGLRLEAGGRVAWTSVSQAMFKQAGANDDDAEGVVEKLREMDGVEIVFVLREAADGTVRVSLRAKHGADVNAVARHFGGGGHLRASGCVMTGPLPEAEKRLLAAVLEHLENENKP